ncbi:MAG: FAD-dependent oxidoreductase [Candidatus Latescibacteria bacterium]|nr:FAD-dependent oxidoreductase [Candidatus Latescibacterota bacterium]
MCDICVVGGGSGGSGGIGAAVCAAEAGADVIIVEAQEMLGSTSTMAGVNA